MTQQLTTMRCTYCNEPVPNTRFDQAQHENVCPNRPKPDAQRERIEQAAMELCEGEEFGIGLPDFHKEHGGPCMDCKPWINFTLAQVEEATAPLHQYIDKILGDNGDLSREIAALRRDVAWLDAELQRAGGNNQGKGK